MRTIDLINRLNNNGGMQESETRSTTRASLIGAGLHLFGRKGFDGTSTREIAGRAGTNIASITYHFGGKAGLRAACATEVAARISNALDAAGALQVPDTAERATAQIELLVRAFVELVVGSPQAQDMVAFMLREIGGTSGVSDAVYANFIEPRHKAMCVLWAMATGRDPDDDDVKLAVFALIGQIVYFRIASPFVARRMSWNSVDADGTQKIGAVIIANLRDAIERQRL